MAISIDHFDLIRVIGRGSYAKVLMVELKETKMLYAMKVIKKELVTDDEVIFLFKDQPYSHMYSQKFVYILNEYFTTFLFFSPLRRILTGFKRKSMFSKQQLTIRFW